MFTRTHGGIVEGCIISAHRSETRGGQKDDLNPSCCNDVSQIQGIHDKEHNLLPSKSPCHKYSTF